MPFALLLHAGAWRGRPAVEDVLQRVGGYVAEYERTLSMVICEERYTQRARLGHVWQTRLLRAEAALLNDENGEWMFFRDVHTVDGIPVR